MPARTSTWIRIRHRLEWALVLGLRAFVSSLPHHALGWIYPCLGTLAYHCDRRGRQTALENIRCVFAGKLDAGEQSQLAKHSYQSFARTLCDLFWSSNLTADNYHHWIHLEFEDEAAVRRVQDKGAIYVTPHYANFEWLATLFGFRDLQFMIIAQEFKNPLLNEPFKNDRIQSGHLVTGRERAMLRLLRHLKQGGNAAFLPDLTVPPSDSATIIDVFGRPTCVSTLHAFLAHRTGLPIIPGISLPQPDGSYRMRVLRPLSVEGCSTREIAQKCWDALAPYILNNPAPWLWMYKHWRYLPAQTNTPYPAYANRSKRFDALMDKLDKLDEQA